MNPETENFLEEETNIIQPLEKEITSASWGANTTGKEEFYEKEVALQKKITEHFRSKERFELVTHLLKQETDELAKRQLELLEKDYLGAQTDLDLLNKETEMSSQIEKEFNSFRATIKGKQVNDNEIKGILKESRNSEEVREAWQASKVQAESVSPKIIELAKIRNQISRNINFDNYYEFSLALGEQSGKEIYSLFEKLERVTREPFIKLKAEMESKLTRKFGLTKDELKPWHYGDLFFQEGPALSEVDLGRVYGKINTLELARRFYESIGLNVIDILEKSDLYEREGKNQHAFCISMDRDQDVRILENVVDNEYWASTTLHELGHGVYEKGVNKSLPFLLRSNAHTFITEGVAMMFERLIKDPDFITNYTKTKISLEEANALAIQEKQRQLVFARWAMTVFNFEKELYSNPDQDLNKTWWDTVKKYQMIDFTRDKPDWASKIHIPCYPMYYHNYLLGELFASQLSAKIKESFPKRGLTDPSLGKYLTDTIFSKGATLRWDQLIQKTFGEGLNPEYFVKELNKE